MIILHLSRVLLIILVFESGGCQQYPETDHFGRCSRGCISPGRCTLGYFHRRRHMKAPFEFCCYQNNVEHRTKYDSVAEWLTMLDCRFRRRSNVLKTETEPDVGYLDLSFNKFHNKWQNLRDEFLQYFPGLKVLIISLSHLKSVPTNFLSSNVALERLVLSWNEITKLPEDLLRHNTALVKVDFSGNKISAIPIRFFQNTPNIEEIRFGYNNIKFVTSDMFRPLPSLRLLDISYNTNLACIGLGVFDYNSKISFVGLKGIGLRVYRGVRDTFCETCARQIHHLKTELRTHEGGRIQTSLEDPCLGE